MRKAIPRYEFYINFSVRLLIFGAIVIGIKFASQLDDFFRIAPFVYSMPILAGTLLVAYSVFPAGERGTSPIYQDKNRKKKYPIGMVDIGLFQSGISYIVIGYFLQVLYEAIKFAKQNV
jgi:hypothetical protein